MIISLKDESKLETFILIAHQVRVWCFNVISKFLDKDVQTEYFKTGRDCGNHYTNFADWVPRQQTEIYSRFNYTSMIGLLYIHTSFPWTLHLIIYNIFYYLLMFYKIQTVHFTHSIHASVWISNHKRKCKIYSVYILVIRPQYDLSAYPIGHEH
jgi:hypothetical protein